MLSRSILLGSAIGMLAASASFADAAVTQLSAVKGAKRLVIVTSDLPTEFTNTKFVDVAFTGKFGIPAAQTGFLVATFTGESQCGAADWCSVRITCDGVELQPHDADPFDFAFNSPGGAVFTSHSVTRRSAPFTGGTHSCVAQSASVGGGTHRLDDWSFVVEFWQQ